MRACRSSSGLKTFFCRGPAEEPDGSAMAAAPPLTGVFGAGVEGLTSGSSLGTVGVVVAPPGVLALCMALESVELMPESSGSSFFTELIVPGVAAAVVVEALVNKSVLELGSAFIEFIALATTEELVGLASVPQFEVIISSIGSDLTETSLSMLMSSLSCFPPFPAGVPASKLATTPLPTCGRPGSSFIGWLSNALSCWLDAAVEDKVDKEEVEIALEATAPTEGGRLGGGVAVLVALD